MGRVLGLEVEEDLGVTIFKKAMKFVRENERIEATMNPSFLPGRSVPSIRFVVRRKTHDSPYKCNLVQRSHLNDSPASNTVLD